MAIVGSAILMVLLALRGYEFAGGAGMTERLLPVPDGLAGERLDVALTRMLGLSRSRAADLVAAGDVLIDGRPAAQVRPAAGRVAAAGRPAGAGRCDRRCPPSRCPA